MADSKVNSKVVTWCSSKVTTVVLTHRLCRLCRDSRDLTNLIFNKFLINRINRIFTNNSNNKWCFNNNNKECSHKWTRTLEWCSSKTWDSLINNSKICSNKDHKCSKCLNRWGRWRKRMWVHRLILISETFMNWWFFLL